MIFKQEKKDSFIINFSVFDISWLGIKTSALPADVLATLLQWQLMKIVVSHSNKKM